MDLGLGIKLSYSIFSFKRKNMRYFNGRRILVTLFLFPLFLVILITNRVFLLLDYIFFPHFLRKTIIRPIFIISPPRTATTFLYHKICEDKEKTTAFKLWEIIFAPSICQKYLLLAFIKLDHFLGGFGAKFILFLQQFFIGKLRKKHLIGLELPEEDEALLLWNLSTVYLNFFYPDSHYFDDYFAFDDALSDKKRNRIMRFYKRCLQRHCFVFDAGGKKTFISKNPIMMSKVKSVAAFFPDARVMSINRCPSSTIPSTIALNESIYYIFTSIKTTEEINNRTKNILINWYKMAHKNREQFFPNALEIPFYELIKKDPETIAEICNYAGISITAFADKKEDLEKHNSNNNYIKLDESALEKVFTELPFLIKKTG